MILNESYLHRLGAGIAGSHSQANTNKSILDRIERSLVPFDVPFPVEVDPDPRARGDGNVSNGVPVYRLVDSPHTGSSTEVEVLLIGSQSMNRPKTKSFGVLSSGGMKKANVTGVAASKSRSFMMISKDDRDFQTTCWGERMFL